MRKAAQKRSKPKVAHCQNSACGVSFRATRTWQRYCSPRCAQAAYFARRLAKTKGLMAECPKCGHEFLVRMAPTI